MSLFKNPLAKEESKKGKPDKKASPSSSPKTKNDKGKAPLSTQEWLPVKDVYNGFYHRKDGYIVAGVRVQPINMDLLSKNEKKRKISMLHEVTNGMDYDAQTMSIGRPVDLDGYIAEMENKKNDAVDFVKRKILEDNIKHAAQMATSGEALERQFYILIAQKPSENIKKSGDMLYRKAVELASNLSMADLTSHVCNDQELRDLLFIFTNPTQSAYERAPDDSGMYLQAVYQEG